MKDRKRLPTTRPSVTHKAIVNDTEFYLTVGLFEDGTPGELFITIAKEGSELGGIYEQFGVAISMLFQSTWTVDELALKFAHTRFEPAGFTNNPDIPIAKSITDYIFRWLAIEFGTKIEIPVQDNSKYAQSEKEVIEYEQRKIEEAGKSPLKPNGMLK